MNSLKIKRGDQVVVIAGSSEDKGKKGKVITTDAEQHRVLVEGINMQKHHTKPRSAKEAGGIVSKEGFIDVSNVMVVCPKCGKAVRVHYKLDENGKKVRFCGGKNGCGAVIDKAAVKKAAKKADKADEKPVKKAAKKSADSAEKKPAKKAPAKKAKAAAEDQQA